jgi:menaquinone-9 beta-reductase
MHMTDQPFDAVIVGAGPAGSAAAIALAEAGRRVLLLDRHAFPRDKPCGDLIGARALAMAKQLGVRMSDVRGYRRLRGALITAAGGGLDLAPGSSLGRRLLARSDARVVPRSVFDHLLVEQAQRRGAVLRQGTVREVGPWDGNSRVVRVVASEGNRSAEMVLARIVIVAGGYGCRVAADVAPRERDDGPARGIAMRGYFRGVESPADRIVFSLDRWLLPGYGWIFPLPDGRANVGVGRLVRDGEDGQVDLGELWRRYTEDDRSPVAAWLRQAEPEGKPRSWPLDLGPRRRRLVSDGLLVAGEAAGLVGPLTGAGIAFALESGRLAGEIAATALARGDISQEALGPYGRVVRRRLAPWLRSELLAQRFLSDPDRVRRFFDVIRPLPVTGATGARLLLHLG